MLPTVSFDMIANLFDPMTVDLCYESNGEGIGEGIKNKRMNGALQVIKIEL